MQSDSKTSADFASCQQGASFFTYDAEIFDEVSPETFSGEYWLKHNAVTGQAKGRGTTWFLKHKDHELVLRHYYRGGLIGKVMTDHYLYFGLKHSRASQEFALLDQLHQLHLPVPKPVAFMVKRSRGIYCVSDIITSRIVNAQSMVALIASGDMRKDLWPKVGACIREFHSHHVFHHDLNAHNILIDDNDKVWLIDFDQGKIITENNHWKKDNLQRLLRSLKKEQGRLNSFHWQEQDWQRLLEGYGS